MYLLQKARKTTEEPEEVRKDRNREMEKVHDGADTGEIQTYSLPLPAANTERQEFCRRWCGNCLHRSVPVREEVYARFDDIWSYG